eukprot:m.1342125 g.1342125  ORF g.1342125 m.1342125 type:complete len:346 (-) comp24898_c1_seq10:62-1099(-)
MTHKHLTHTTSLAPLPMPMKIRPTNDCDKSNQAPKARIIATTSSVAANTIVIATKNPQKGKMKRYHGGRLADDVTAIAPAASAPTTAPTATSGTPQRLLTVSEDRLPNASLLYTATTKGTDTNTCNSTSRLLHRRCCVYSSTCTVGTAMSSASRTGACTNTSARQQHDVCGDAGGNSRRYSDPSTSLSSASVHAVSPGRSGAFTSVSSVPSGSVVMRTTAATPPATPLVRARASPADPIRCGGVPTAGGGTCGGVSVNGTGDTSPSFMATAGDPLVETTVDPVSQLDSTSEPTGDACMLAARISLRVDGRDDGVSPSSSRVSGSSSSSNESYAGCCSTHTHTLSN